MAIEIISEHAEYFDGFSSGVGIVVHANWPPEAASKRRGLIELLRLRREARSKLPALVYSFETRDELRRRFSILDDGVPGIDFLRAPFSIAEFRSKFETLELMTDNELTYVLRWHAGLQDEWRTYAHDFGHLLESWPKHREDAKRLLAKWEDTVTEYAPDQTKAMRDLKASIDAGRADVFGAAQALENGLCHRSNKVLRVVPKAPHARPPRGYDSIAIGDDSGYEQDTIARLKLLGYKVHTPARTLSNALRQLELARPRVLLADLNFPTASEGITLMRAAFDPMSSVRLVIAVSRASVPHGLLPPGVEDCSGGRNFQDAELIHRTIWCRAQREGVTEHV